MTVRELSVEERACQRDTSRDYLAVEIKRTKRAGHDQTPWTFIIGGPAVGSFDEVGAARSAISFATAPWCADTDEERAWMEEHGEALSNAATCHSVLRTEDE